jgi:predicted membrane channel-forming protein YqfA (hemolysin III family)
VRLTTPFDARHPFLMAGVRLAAGLWLLFLFAALMSIGDWWGAVLLLPAGLLFAVGAYVLVVLSPRRDRRTTGS